MEFFLLIIDSPVYSIHLQGVDVDQYRFMKKSCPCPIHWRVATPLCIHNIGVLLVLYTGKRVCDAP